MKANLNPVTIAIIAINNDNVIYQFNEGAEKLLGYSASELLGKKKSNFFILDEEYEKFKKDIASKYKIKTSDFNPYKILAQNDDYDAREWTIVKKDGTRFIAHSTLIPLKSDKGENVGFMRILKNITDLKKIENDLLRKNQVLNAAEKITMMGNWQWHTVINKVEWSSNLFNIFGVDPKENLNFETYFSFVHPEDKEKVSISFEKSIKDKKFYDLLHRIKLKSGKTKTIQLLGEVVLDEDTGEVIELIGTCQDVTEQRMAEIKFRGLLESAPDAMVIVNDFGIIQLINKQAEKLFGYSSQELINKPVELLIPNRYKDKHSTHRDLFFSAPIAKKMGEGRELYGVNKAGKEIPIQISLSPLKTEEGLLVSAAIRDITVQKKAENKILEANERLEVLANKLTAQNTQLADFAQITSHNLRAPVSNLNSLMGFYKMAETEEEKILAFEKFEIVIHHLTDTLNTLIEALKTKNRTSIPVEKLDFNEILNKTVQILSGQIISTNTKINSNFENVTNINYNRAYLESIFLNLLSNAIKYKSEDKDPEIYVFSVLEDGAVKLKFKDNGLGIDLERHGHKLFGLNKVFHRHPDANGVGLFMTKVQIESLGGTITVESEVNVGSTFSVNFKE